MHNKNTEHIKKQIKEMTLEKQFNNFLQNVQVQLCSLPFKKQTKKNLDLYSY